jgi:glycosyltransferase involved in cell wall biosynthesis
VNSDYADGSMGDPVISVCVPMYNNSATIARCLRSILDQDGVEYEIVVVDDDSSDGSAAIAAPMLRVGDRLIRNESRLGLNQNHNKCLELALGSYVQFVHGDDWLLPGALQTLSRFFDDPTVGLAFAPRRVVTHYHQWQLQYGTPHTHFRRLQTYNHGLSLVMQMAWRGMKQNWIGEPTCVMFRRRLALDAGGFRNDIYNLVDLDLWLRLMLRSAACFVPQELSVRNQMAATAAYHNWATRRDWLDRLRVLTWMIVDPTSPIITRITAAVWWIPTWLRLGLGVAVHGPHRWLLMKTLVLAPYREFAQARRFRHGLTTVRGSRFAAGGSTSATGKV